MPYLTPTASLQDINAVLTKTSIQGWNVHSRMVEFNDKDDKMKKMSIFTNKLKATNNPQDIINLLVKEAFDGDTISEGLKSMKQKGSIVMLSGDWEKDLGNEVSLDEKKLHVHLLFLKERKVCFIFLSLVTIILIL
jgi:hypothetical protein